MDPVIKRIPDLRTSEPLKSGDFLIVSQYTQGTNKIRKTTVGALKAAILAGYNGGGANSGGSELVVDEHTVEIRINNEFIQWRFQEGTWYNLISLTEIREEIVPPMSMFDGDDETLHFYPVEGLTSLNPRRYQVVVGGVVQQPSVSYTLSTDNGGTLIFDQAPPSVPISIQPY